MKKLIIIWAVALFAIDGYSQNLHFSMYELNPIYLCPTNAGLFDGVQRASVIYRNQWASIANPYQTVSISYDKTSLLDHQSYDQVGYGGVIMSDVSAGGAYKIFKLMSSGAYHKNFDNTRESISLGFQAGITQQALDPTLLLYPDQISNGELSSEVPTSDVLINGRVLKPEFGAGAVWSYHSQGNYLKRLSNKKVLRRDTKESTELKVGAALNQINSPDFNSLGSEFKLKPRLTLYAEGRLNLGYDFHIYPRAMYMKQRSASTLNIGADFEYMLHNKTDDAALLGIRARSKDAVLLIAGYKMADYQFFLGYDINASSLATASSGYGAIEIGFVYVSKRTLRINCPKFSKF